VTTVEVGMLNMQENNSTDENTQNQPSDQHEPVGPPPVGGDVFHPETSQDSTPSEPSESPVDSPTSDNSDSSTPESPEEKPELLAIPPKPAKKDSKKSLLMIVVALLLLVGGVAGWWFTKDSNDKGNKTANSAETKDIDVLKIGSGEGPASVYFPDEGVNGVQNIIDHQIYEGLVGLEDTKIVPFVAQSWTNPDDTTWIFKIRPNVKFHTGKTVTAKEVKASLDDLNKYDYWSLFTSTIASVEVTGDLEVTIKTKEPDALLLNRLVLAYITDLTAADKAGNNGTGAYQVDTTAKNDEKSTTLVAFDDHYAGHVKTRKLIYSIYESDDALVKAIKAHEVDMIETLPIPSVKKELEGAGFGTSEYESPGAFGIYMNQIRSSKTILANKDFRMAIALAMDRQGLIDKVGNKNTPATQVIPKSLPGHDESISFPAFDLTAAKASLVKSGYKNEPIEFVYIKDLQVDAPFLIEQLKALGLNIKEKVYSSDDTDTALAELRAGKFDLFLAGFTSDISDARDILGALLSSTESTYPIYKDAVYDKLLSDSDKAFDPAERIKLLQQANKYIIDNVAWIPLRNGVYIAYHAKDLDIHVQFNGGGSLGAYFRKVGRISK
jgi:peptide/nickel transport system substrate-binding protein